MGRATKTTIAVLALFAIPRCSCQTSQKPATPDCAAESAPNATFVLAPGYCGSEYCDMRCNDGFVDCDDDQSNGCETSTDLSALHEHVGYGGGGGGGGCGGGGGEVVGTLGSCSITCEVGWLDCDKQHPNGCETQGSVCGPKLEASTSDATSPPTASKILTLKNDTLGLVACAGAYYVLDGAEIRTLDGVTLVSKTLGFSPGTPSGGLACDGTSLYWTIRADVDAGSVGALLRMDITTGTVDILANGLDPGVGVDVRGGSVYFIARSGIDDAGSTLATFALDAGAITPWMPASETQTYKVFALSDDGDWSVANGTIFRRKSDAGAAAWLEAPVAALLTNEAGAPFAVVHADLDASSDALPHDYLAALHEDDAGDASLSPIDASTLDPIIATTGAAPPVVASRDKVYALALPAGGATLVNATTAPIAFVAIDDTWVIWSTRATTSAPAAVWRTPRP